MKDNNSLYWNVNESKFWLAISAEFDEPTEINIDVNQFLFSEDNTPIYSAFILYSPENDYFYSLYYPDPLYKHQEYYFQINIGEINFSYYYNEQNESIFEQIQSEFVFRNLSGRYYCIFMAYSDESTMDLWINTTEKTIFSAKQGTEVFSFGREDFFGKINIGWKKGTIIISGTKSIRVNNTLFAWYHPRGTTGFGLFRCFSPSNDLEWKFYFDYIYEHIFEIGSTFLDITIIGGENGTWTFKADIINFSIIATQRPNVILLGADIELPE